MGLLFTPKLYIFKAVFLVRKAITQLGRGL